MNIYVGNLAWKTRQKELRELFENFGEVTNTFIVRDKKTRRSRGFGFVDMVNDSDALEAIEKLNNTVFLDRTISVNEAIPKEESDDSTRPGETVIAPEGTPSHADASEDAAGAETPEDEEVRTDTETTDDPAGTETVKGTPSHADASEDAAGAETPEDEEVRTDTETTDDPAGTEAPGDEEDQKKEEKQ